MQDSALLKLKLLRRHRRRKRRNIWHDQYDNLLAPELACSIQNFNQRNERAKHLLAEICAWLFLVNLNHPRVRNAQPESGTFVL